MAGSINRFPDGLLAFLDLKTRGETPSDLGSTVAPIIDLLPFYELGATAVWTRTAGLTISQTYTSSVVVPDGEIWLVRAGTVKVEALGPGTWSGSLVGGASDSGLQLNALAAWGGGTVPYISLTAVGDTFNLQWQPTWPLFARAGWRFGTFTDRQTGGGYTATTSILATRFRA